MQQTIPTDCDGYISDSWKASMCALSILLVLSASAYGATSGESSLSYQLGNHLQDGSLRRAELRELKQAEPVERQIAKGQSHSYRITLTAGQYINVTVEQKDVDVSIQLLNPAGERIAGINWEDKDSTESLWALGEVVGGYQLDITAPSVQGKDPRYVVRLEKVAYLQTASTSDQAYVKAHRLLWEAVELGKSRIDQSLHQAAERLQQALPLWRALNDKVGEGHTLRQLASVYTGLRERQKSMELYEQALKIWQAAQNRQGEEADTLYEMGAAYSFFGRAVEAVACYKKSIELSSQIGDQSRQAFAHNNLGQTYIDQGEFQAALDSHKEALRLRQATEDIEGQARSLSNIAGVYFYLGEFQESLNYSKQALPIRLKARDRRGEAITLSNIGSIYRELGDPRSALEYVQRALQTIREVGDQFGEAGILDSIARIYCELGDNERALEHHQKSLSLRRMLNDRFGEGATLASLGNVYSKMGQRQKALDCFERSLQLRREFGDRRGEALILRDAGEVYREQGDFPKALTYFEQGLALSRAIKNQIYEAHLLYSIARVELVAGHLAEARSRIEKAIAVIESTRSKVARADLRTSFLASKQDFYELEIDVLMQLNRRQGDRESLAEALSLSEQRRARSLLDSLEEARARIRQGVSPDLLAREHALQIKLNQRAESQIKLLSSKYNSEQADKLEKEVEAIAEEYRQVLAEIRASSPRYAALTQPAPLNLREIQRDVLYPNTILLEYSLGKERSYLWAVTTTKITGFQLPPRAEVESLARRVYNLMTSRNEVVKFEENHERHARIARADAEYERTSGELSRILLGPVAAQIQSKRLLVVADGALQYLSFAALPVPAASSQRMKQRPFIPLIAAHEIINVPSASTLAVLRKETRGRSPAPKTVVVLADPVFDKGDERVKNKGSDIMDGNQSPSEDDNRREDENTANELTRSAMDLGLTNKHLRFPRLPFTRREAKTIAALAADGESKAVTDFSANRAAAISPEMSQYRYLHFATHGLLNNTHPELSGIVLSLVDKEGKDNNGFLLTNEIYNLNLPAELIVLSGCRTGLGKELKGEGIVGLTRAFMYAGAPRVLVSLWDVNDESTAELMAHFYKAMLGKKRLNAAAALRDAQLSMLNSTRWRMPYFWSAFVLQGEYQ